jgi:putative membrane protein
MHEFGLHRLTVARPRAKITPQPTEPEMKSLLAGFALLLALPVATIAIAQDAKKESPQASAKGGLDKKDAGYLRRMGEADLAEVEAGKLAAGKASSEEVKKFAQHMVEEHGKGMEEGRKLAESKRVELPTEPSKKHQAAMKKLEQQSGAEFDRAYMKQMVQDHQDTLKLVQEAAKNARDAEIKAAAQKKVATVQEHLKMARQHAASLGGGKGEKGKDAGAGGTSRKAESK